MDFLAPIQNPAAPALPIIPMGEGSPDSPIMIVGECWGDAEERALRPFQGPAGRELFQMLHDSGILVSQCYLTNLVNSRPKGGEISAWVPAKKSDIKSSYLPLRNRYVDPIIVAGYESLKREISLVRPRIIIALGNTALWALTGQWGTLKWRGSLLNIDGDPQAPRVIPTLHPSAVLRQWELRPIVINDLRRARRELESPAQVPEWNFRIRPTLAEVLRTFEDLKARAHRQGPLWVDFDIETAGGHITCVGVSWSRTDCICIPFIRETTSKPYWVSAEEEGMVVWALYRLLTDPNVWVRGQNLLYDCQYTHRHWHFIPNVKQDTMLLQHSLFCGMQKSLAFQASMYCDWYSYWKDMSAGKQHTLIKAGD